MQSEREEKLKHDIDCSDLAGLEQELSAMNNLIDILRQMEANGEIVIERFE